MRAQSDTMATLVFFLLSLFINNLRAAEETDTMAPVIDNVTIIGHQQNPADVAGSAHVVSNEELNLLLQSDVMRVLRAVPGVYLQEEDGFGLRPNIGIRGSGLDRSARIALLEDGVLIAPAPYSAPSAYYFPTQRRMHAIEVLKGPSSISVGPRTTGGAVNLISTPIPDAFAGAADIRVGQNNTLDALLNLGNRGERFSWLVETVQTKTDGFKTIDVPPGTESQNSGFDISDYMIKLQLDSAPSSSLYQSLRLKAGLTDQVSDETYLGLTDEDFAANPNRRYAASSGDQFVSDHQQLQLSYIIEPESNWSGTITAYRNEFRRNWFKLQSVEGTGIGDILDDTLTYADEFGYLKGATSPDDAVVKRHNNRSYLSQGVQGSITWALGSSDTEADITVGTRIHEDEEDRLQKEDGFRMQDLLLIPTSQGSAGSQTNRLSYAAVRAAFVDTSIRAGRWDLTPGVRFENIDLTRNDYSKSDPDRVTEPTKVRTNNISVVIPGMGALYKISDQWRVLAGVHKGFNPPAPGSSASEESSVNFEAGFRYNNDSLSVESILFYNDFDNLVGTVTASTGGDGEIGDQFDGGAATVSGLELSGNYVWAGLNTTNIEIPLSLRYTWTADATFSNSFKSGYSPWGDVQAGDELPYIPEHQLRAAASIESQRWSATLAANYVGEMRTVAGQGAFVDRESIRSHVVWDALGRWQINDMFGTYLKVDNLLDEVYVAARRPSGVRPGLERTGYAGVTIAF